MDVFRTCAEKNALPGASYICQQWLVNVTNPSRETEEDYGLELLNRALGIDMILGTSEMCDIFVFKYHNLYLFNLSTPSLSIIATVQKKIVSSCQCPIEIQKQVEERSPPQSIKRNIPNHFYYGGLKNYECWKEVDQYLAVILCGENSTSEYIIHMNHKITTNFSVHINQEWARRADCLEDPKFSNCSPKFIEEIEVCLEGENRLLIDVFLFQKISKESEKPLFCSTYVEIIGKALLIFNRTSFNYTIVYKRETIDSDLHWVQYRDDELYLMSDLNDDILFKCFSFKRTITACNFTFTLCNRSFHDQCDKNLIECFKKDNWLSQECLAVLIPPKYSADILSGFVNLAKNHYWAVTALILVAIVLAGCNKLRDWLFESLSIKLFIFLTKQFDKGADYFDALLKNDSENRRTDTGTTEVGKVATSTVDNSNNKHESFGEDGGEPLLPVNPPAEYQNNSNTSNTPSTSSISNIATEQTPSNNQSEVMTSSNNENGNPKLDETKDKPQFSSSLKNMGKSFWRINCSMWPVLYQRCKFPSFKTIRNASVEGFQSIRNRRKMLPEVSVVCQKWIENVTESLENNKDAYIMTLLDKTFHRKMRRRSSEVCDVSVFEHPDFSNSLNLTLSVITELPTLIFSFCQCPNRPINDDRPRSHPPTHSSFPIHFYYGGLRNIECWKEVDRYLVETLCGEKSLLQINHEWARRTDCLENPALTNCTPKFLERLESISKESRRSTFCSAYVEIIEKSLPFFNSTTFDYNIVPVNISVTSGFPGVHYQDDDLYLLSQLNDNITFKCFPVKRAITSCNYSYIHCSRHFFNQCDESFIECLKDENEFSPECVEAMFPIKNFAQFLIRLLNRTWNYKWEIFFFVAAAIVFAFSKKLRDWLFVLLTIKLCLALTGQFDRAAAFFDGLLLGNPEEPESKEMQINSGFSDNEQDENLGSNNHNPDKIEEDVTLDFPFIDDAYSRSTETSSDQIREIDGGSQSESSRDRPRLPSTSNDMWKSFRKMNSNMFRVLHRRFICPAFNAAAEYFLHSEGRNIGNHENSRFLP
ncbi:hypothetical protein CRE_30977 [Caenorhabditis remanei]|uniref:Uncharacterized protein n=1 Tax=Caenorhabditis remanei TaxID=31234 RepID=E3LTW3_CAERE|nr:hypothetical protein CRE_30977 [Caenorhabditis remanei]